MYANILVPVLLDDGRSTKGSGPTDASCAAARGLAADGAKFTVLHVLEPIPTYAAVQVPAELLAKARHEAETTLQQTAQGLPGSAVALISGHPGRAIVEYATKHEVDCIVIASHVPGFSNIFLGSTAERVVRHARCSVHVIR